MKRQRDSWAARWQTQTNKLHVNLLTLFTTIQNFRYVQLKGLANVKILDMSN